MMTDRFTSSTEDRRTPAGLALCGIALVGAWQKPYAGGGHQPNPQEVDS